MITTRLLENLQEKIPLSCKQTNKSPKHKKKKNLSAVSDLMNEKQITKIGEGNVKHTCEREKKVSPFLVWLSVRLVALSVQRGWQSTDL